MNSVETAAIACLWYRLDWMRSFRAGVPNDAAARESARIIEEAPDPRELAEQLATLATAMLMTSSVDPEILLSDAGMIAMERT